MEISKLSKPCPPTVSDGMVWAKTARAPALYLRPVPIRRCSLKYKPPVSRRFFFALCHNDRCVDHFRHDHIGNQKIKRFGVQNIDVHFAITGFGDLVYPAVQRPRAEQTHRVFVVHQQVRANASHITRNRGFRFIVLRDILPLNRTR
jgi:hypothetical protein